MEHATRLHRLAGSAGRFLFRCAHGGLLAAGLAAVIVVLPKAFDQESVSFGDTGMAVAAEATPVDAVEGSQQAQAEIVPAAIPPTVTAASVPARRTPKLSVEMRRVRDYIAERYRVSSVALEPVLAAAEASGRKVGIDPLLIVAVMAVESSFNPFAESQGGAQGLMQIIPRFHMDKIGAAAGADALFDPQLNIQVGTAVLREGLKRFGDLEAALQYYGGALDDPAASYARKVLAIKERLSIAARRAAGATASSAGV